MQTANQFYKNYFGQKVYKISLDAGCTCPNRDGTAGIGGCIFCSNSGSGDFTPAPELSITDQIEQARKLVDSKFSRKAKLQMQNIQNSTEGTAPCKNTAFEQHKYIAYFQNFTNTYGNPEKLKEKWLEALENPQIAGLAIGTRPDCLPQEILNILSELAEKTFIQIELGLQTSNDYTAEFLNRGYATQIYIDAVKKLHQANKKIHVVTHIIFGLPKPLSKNPLLLKLESLDDELNTLQTALKAGTDGIKITCLYILKNTKLGELYQSSIPSLFPALTEEEYFFHLQKALKIIPQEIVIHRITGDPPKSLLIEPQWTANKKEVLNRINRLKNLM